MEVRDIIFDFCSVSGVSGNEAPATAAAKKYFSKYAEITIDHNGNMYAESGNKSADKTIIVDAHIDRIGFMVTEIDDNGFVKIDKCGGIDIRTLQDTEVVLQNYPEITGVICCMPPHLSDGSDNKATPISKTYVDFGMPYSQITDYVSVGDLVTYKSKPKMLLNDRVASACLDNRCGITVLAKCAELISKYENLKYKVIFLMSVQEETFGLGAKTASYITDADEAIAVDVSFASQPDISGQYSQISLDKGPMICISPVLNRKMSNMLIEIAKQKDIPYQIEPVSGTTGTNADNIAVSKGGIKSSVVSIPQRYMHTPNEVISLADIDNTARLIAEYIISGGAFDD